MPAKIRPLLLCTIGPQTAPDPPNRRDASVAGVAGLLLFR
jgi:hypothetical protein